MTDSDRAADVEHATCDLAVIGLGLIGCGALRHGALRSESVVGVGPAEPVDWSNHTGAFASHYDSGRITRRTDSRLEWAILASRAIEHYPSIEATSGIRFHEPCGLAFVRNDTTGIEQQRSIARDLGIPLTVGDSDAAPAEDPTPGGHERASYRLPPGWTVLREPEPAGFIDPRRMIEAQLAAAEKAGAEIVRDEVVSLQSNTGQFTIVTRGGMVLSARRVVLATGAYGGELRSGGPSLSIRPEPTLLARVDDDLARRLESLPSLIWLLDHDDLLDVYIVPPTRYPDGHRWIKLGGSFRNLPSLETADAMAAWMQSEPDHLLDPMAEVLRQVLPDVQFSMMRTKPCLISDTPSGLPVIDHVGDGIVVARGGNGHAAKSADAIGALAVDLAVTGTWNDPDLNAAAFSIGAEAGVVGRGSRLS